MPIDYEQHIVTIDGKDYIDGHRIKTGNEFVIPVLPIKKSWNVTITRWKLPPIRNTTSFSKA